MEAAERLFAARGLDGVALREIAAAAGQGNNTAVQYHFGTKERLVYEIFYQRSRELETMRGEMLAEAESAGRLADARVLLQIMVLPHLTLCDTDGAHPYSAFLAQFLTRSPVHGMQHPYDDPTANLPVLRRVRQLIAERIPYVPAPALRLRVSTCKLMFLDMLTRRDSGMPQWAEGLTLASMVDDTLDMMTAALVSPWRYGRDPLFDGRIGTA